MQSELSEFSQKQRYLILAGAVILILLLNGVLALFTLHTANERHLTSVKNLHITMDALESGRNAQVHFKKQVQEWKNILLRGSNPNDFQRYLKSFTTEEEAVQRELTELQGISEMIQLDLDVEPLKKEHREMGRRYREALDRYNPKDPQTMLQVDHAVRGIDRIPTDAMDDFVDRIRASADQDSQMIEKETAESYRIWRKIVISAMIVGIVLVSLMLWLSLYRFKK